MLLVKVCGYDQFADFEVTPACPSPVEARTTAQIDVIGSLVPRRASIRIATYD